MGNQSACIVSSTRPYSWHCNKTISVSMERKTRYIMKLNRIMCRRNSQFLAGRCCVILDATFQTCEKDGLHNQFLSTNLAIRGLALLAKKCKMDNLPAYTEA